VIRRVLIGALLATALLPSTASAAVTRAIQAFDTPTFRTIWTPRNVPAQVTDTIEWRFTEPGNPNQATHDLWLVAPGGTPQQLGASYLGPIQAPINLPPGTYQFYCSISLGNGAGHAVNGMVGTITIH